MFDATSTDASPWVSVDGNDGDRGRLEAMRQVVNGMKATPEKARAANGWNLKSPF